MIELIRRLKPADVSVFAAHDFIDVRFRLHVRNWRDLALASAFLSLDQKRKPRIRLVK